MNKVFFNPKIRVAVVRKAIKYNQNFSGSAQPAIFKIINAITVTATTSIPKTVQVNRVVPDGI